MFAAVVDVVSSDARSGLPSELLYADDLVIMAPTMEQLGIQKHKQNIWKEHLDAHWDHRHNTHTLWKTIHGLSNRAPPHTHCGTIMFLLRAVLNILVRNASRRRPMCFRCLIFNIYIYRVGNLLLLGHGPFSLEVTLNFKGTEASWEGTKATFYPSPGAPRPV